MNCSVCEKANKECATFCTSCGTKLAQVNEAVNDLQKESTEKCSDEKSKYCWYIILGFFLYFVSIPLTRGLSQNLQFALDSANANPFLVSGSEVTGGTIALGVLGHVLAFLGFLFIFAAVKGLMDGKSTSK